MALAIVYSRASRGVEAPPVTVEVHLANGLPAFSIVGLPETAVKESRDRVRGAVVNSRFKFPTRRITVNLAPADLPKEGGRFDLAIALGILAASGQLPDEPLAACEFVGELALSGALRCVRGVFPVSLQACEAGRTLVVPAQNGAEAALVTGARVLTASHLLEVCAGLSGEQKLAEAIPPVDAGNPAYESCMSDVRGQPHAKRVLEVAAAGGHSLLMVGSPGTGKSMLAMRLPGILPPMSDSEAMESAAVSSTSARGFDPVQWRRRPFRSPHHTASGVALAGGGSHPRPGEISLAHEGVLFLDELPEFDRRTLEVLREPLETGRICIARAAHSADFPARFQLVAAMNPCPCGYLGDSTGRCRCTAAQVERYRERISGPLLDRIDMHIEVQPVERAVLRAPRDGEEDSTRIRERVSAARERQLARAGKPNHRLTPREVEQHCELDTQGTALLDLACERLGLSARAYHRILRVARTIADLDASEPIRPTHLSEAISYRCLDRMSAGAEASYS